jgi:uncharacterized delta-60 repeat protein
MSGGGDLDPSFGTGGKVITNLGIAPREQFANAVIRQADGKIVAGGGVLTYVFDYSFDFALVRFNSDGSLDTSFDGDGKVHTDFYGVREGNEQIYAMALQPDGKIVAVGTSGNGDEDDYYDFALARYNTDGSLDTSFGYGGLVTTDFGSNDDSAQAVAIQPNGKIVVAGYNALNGYDFALARYNTNGSLDTTFDGDGFLTTDFGTSNDDDAYGIAVQPDGKVIAAGYSYNSATSHTDFAVVRYNSDGSLDTTFDGDGKALIDFSGQNDFGATVALQPDGKIVVGGEARYDCGYNCGVNPDFGLVRLTSDGSLDTTFDGDGKLTTAVQTYNYPTELLVQPDGKIAMSGYSSPGGPSDFTLVRYNPDGSLDTTFDGDGKVTTNVGGYDGAESLTIQADNRLVAAGYSGDTIAVVSFNANGSLDTTFSGDGKVTAIFEESEEQSQALAVQSDGKIVAGGYTDAENPNGNQGFALVRYTAAGSLDTTFDTDGKVITEFNAHNPSEIHALAVQSDGKIVAAGYASMGLTINDFAIARYNPNGSLDTTFDSDGKVNTDFQVDFIRSQDKANAIAIQTDGKIVVAGSVDDASNGPGFRLGVSRYNPDGSLDTSFDGDGKVVTSFPGFSVDALAVAVQPDGKIVTAGYVGNNMVLVRYNTDGSLDTTFDGDGQVLTDFYGGEDEVRTLAVQPNGKIIAAGLTDGSFALVRYNHNGSLDTGFGTGGRVVTDFGTGNSEINDITLLADGRILAAGRAGYYYEQDFGLALYNSDGSLDTNFSGDGKVTTDFEGGRIDFAKGVDLQADGKFVVVGATFDGFAYDFALARYQAPGAPIGTATLTPTGTPGCVPSSWGQQAGYPIPVLDQAVTEHGGFIYSFSGYSNNSYTANAYKYDPATNVWTSIASLPFPREKASAVSDGTYIYVLGGWDTAGTPTNTVYRYNPATNSYSTMASFNTPTSAQAAAYLNGKIYRIGGCAGNCGAGTATVEVYTIGSNTWAAAASLPNATSWPHAFVQGNYIYVAGGFNPNATSKTLRYDPSSNSWDDAAITDMPSTRWSAASASFNGRWILAGGDVDGYTSNDVIAWDPATNAWSSLSPMPVSRGRTEGAAINGAFYVAGGSGISGGFIGTNNLQRYVEMNCTTNTPLPTNTIVPSATSTPTSTPTGCTPDTTFGTGGKSSTNFGVAARADAIQSIVRQPDGKLVTVGYTYASNDTPNSVLVRYNPDGSLDTTFGTGGFVFADFGDGGEDALNAVVLQPDGKLVVAGYATLTDDLFATNDAFLLARYNSDGTLDATFGTGGVAFTDITIYIDQANALLRQGDGKFVAAGYAGSDFALVRYNSNGSLDTTFDTDGKATTSFPTGYAYAHSIAAQPDGKFVVAGDSFYDFAVARYNSDGSLDTSFSGDGKLTTDFGYEDAARSVLVQSDGRIVAGGYSDVDAYSSSDFVMARYNSDGSFDTSFDGDGKVSTSLAGYERGMTFVLQPDGKIVAGGFTTPLHDDFGLVRYNSDGSLDSTFDGDGKVTTDFGGNRNDQVLALLIEPGGNIVAAGSSGTGSIYGGDTDFALARYTSTGALDTAFSTDGKVSTPMGGTEETANTVLVQPDGKVIVAGSTKYGFYPDLAVSRYNVDGSIDTGFGTGGKVSNDLGPGLSSDRIQGAALQSDGKIVVAGVYQPIPSSPKMLVARYNTNGTFDTSFGTGGILSITFSGYGYSTGAAAAIQQDGKIIAAGSVGDSGGWKGFALVRLNSDGTFDTTFDGDGKVVTTAVPGNLYAEATTLALHAGKIVVAGHTAASCGSNCFPSYDFALARYNSDGSLDTSLSGDGIATADFGNSDKVHALAVQADGKYVVAGDSGPLFGNTTFALARFNTDGTLDTTFDDDGKVTTEFRAYDDVVRGLAVQSSGKLLAVGGSAGAHNDFGGTDYEFALARYNPNGSLDTSFGMGGKSMFDLGGSSDIATSITIQPDGKPVIAGSTFAVNDDDFVVLRYANCDSLVATPTPTATGTPPTATPMDTTTPTITATATRTNTATATATGTPTPCSSATQTVSIMDFAFSPQSKTVYVGETVRWTNNGSANHTSTSDTGVWNSGTMSPGATFNFTFSAPGTYTYKCNIHPSMTGTITVQAGCPPTSTPTATATRTATNTASVTPTSQPAVTSTPCATNVARSGSGSSIAGFSSSYGGAYGPEKMIDGTAGGWSTAGGQVTNQWIIVALPGGNSYTIDSVRLNPYTAAGPSYAADSIRNFQVRVSTTDTQMSSFATVYTGVAPQQNAFYEYNFTPVAAKYVMLFVVDNYGGGFVEGTEFEVYPVCGTPTPTFTSGPTSTATDTATQTNTPTDTNTVTNTPTQTATSTATQSNTATSTNTPGGPTETPTSSSTATFTATPTNTPAVGARVLCVWTSPGVTTYSPCANPTAFASIQSAINAANPGDEIRLVQGVHMGTGSAVGVINKALTITGGYAGGMTGWGVPQPNSSTTTIVDGQGVRKGFEVQGTIAVTIQNLAISSGGILNNAGTVNVPGYILNLQSGGTSNGAFNVSTGAVLNFPSGAHTLDVGTTITGAGMWRVSGGNVTMAGTMSVPRIELSNGGLGGTNALTVTETLNWSGGVQSGAGTTYIPAGATLSLNTTTKYLDGRTINNDGTITWMGADIIYAQNGAVINNHSLFDTQNDSGFYWNGGAVSTFNNTGTFRKSAGTGTTYFSSNVIFNNSGTVNTQIGTLSVQGGGSSSGLWNTPAGAAVAFPASTYTPTRARASRAQARSA